MFLIKNSTLYDTFYTYKLHSTHNIFTFEFIYLFWLTDVLIFPTATSYLVYITNGFLVHTSSWLTIQLYTTCSARISYIEHIIYAFSSAYVGLDWLTSLIDNFILYDTFYISKLHSAHTICTLKFLRLFGLTDIFDSQ